MFLYKFVIGVIHDYRLCLRLLTLVNAMCHNPKSKRDWHMIKKIYKDYYDHVNPQTCQARTSS